MNAKLTEISLISFTAPPLKSAALLRQLKALIALRPRALPSLQKIAQDSQISKRYHLGNIVIC